MSPAEKEQTDIITMIIVDDEEIIRNGLSFYFSTADLGIEVVAALSNGQQAIRYLEQHPVDIVLTDVSMPEKNGLDVAAYVAQHLPDTHTVIISGYQEFAYAQKAIEYGVVSYLVKPVRLNQLTDCFSRIVKQIRFERESQDIQESERKQLEQHLPLLQAQYLAALASDGIKADAERRQEMAGLGFGRQTPDRPFALVTVEIRVQETSQQDSSFCQKAARQFLSHQTSLAFRDKSQIGNRLAFFAYDPGLPDAVALTAAVRQQIERAAEACMDVFGFRFIMQDCQTFASLSELQQTLTEEKQSGASDAGADHLRSTHPTVQQAMVYLTHHYTENVSLSMTADAVHMNAMYFSRLFKQTVGMTFTDFLIKLRMDKAKILLRSDDMKVFEVAHAVGYDNDKYFIRLFKRSTGLTPDAFRRKQLAARSQAGFRSKEQP